MKTTYTIELHPVVLAPTPEGEPVASITQVYVIICENEKYRHVRLFARDIEAARFVHNSIIDGV